LHVEGNIDIAGIAGAPIEKLGVIGGDSLTGVIAFTGGCVDQQPFTVGEIGEIGGGD